MGWFGHSRQVQPQNPKFHYEGALQLQILDRDFPELAALRRLNEQRGWEVADVYLDVVEHDLGSEFFEPRGSHERHGYSPLPFDYYIGKSGLIGPMDKGARVLQLVEWYRAGQLTSDVHVIRHMQSGYTGYLGLVRNDRSEITRYIENMIADAERNAGRRL